MTADPALRLLAAAKPPGGQRCLLIGTGADADLLRAHAAGYPECYVHGSEQPGHDGTRAAAAAISGGITCLLGDLPCAERSPECGEDSLPGTRFPENHFDRVLLRLGRGTAQVNSALSEAFRMLRVGGELIVAGGNQEGIKSFAKRAEAHFGNLDILAIKSSCRLLRMRKEAAMPAAPVEDPGYYRSLRHILAYPGGEVAYLTKPGVFAYRGTDAGTALLGRHLPDCTGRKVLDLGCGSGPLSLAAFARGAAEVLACDNSAIALACAERNFAAAGLPGRVLCSDLGTGAPGGFDLIISNPPFHADGETDYSLPDRVVEAVARLLRPGGEAYLVANQFLDYAVHARRRFQTCANPARENGYSIHHMVLPA